MPRQSKNLSPRQSDLVCAIETFRDERGFGPAIVDLAGALGISVSGAKSLVSACIRKGHVALDPGVARSIRVIRPDAPTG
ncbi:MAG: LexA binding domain [Planctomycetota bacterium]|jgi:SOS-response transcriptional repressor LexA